MRRALLVVLACALPLPAAAQTSPPLESSFDAPSDRSAAAERACAEGRVRTEGRCCWPGQWFSLERGRCEGAPLCPLGLVEHGEACMEPAFSRLPGPEVASAHDDVPAGYTAGPDASTEGWASLADLDETRPTARSQAVEGEDEGHIIASFVVFDVAYVLGWLVAVLDDATGSCATRWGGPRASCNSWWFAALPVAGGMLSGITSFGSSRNTPGFGLGLGIPSLLFQAAGLIALGISFANHTDEHAPRPLEVELTMAAPDSDVGGGFRVRF